MQRRHRTLHADAEGAVPLSPPLSESRRRAANHRRVHRALQRRVADRTTRSPHAGGRANRDGGGVSGEMRSHSGVRIDDQRGGRYVGIHLRCPENRERYNGRQHCPHSVNHRQGPHLVNARQRPPGTYTGGSWNGGVVFGSRVPDSRRRPVYDHRRAAVRIHSTTPLNGRPNRLVVWALNRRDSSGPPISI